MTNNQSYGGTDEAERTNQEYDQKVGDYEEGDSEVPGESVEGSIGFDTPEVEDLLDKHREQKEDD